MKLFRDISPSLILKEKVPLCQPHQCHCEHRHFLPSEDVCLFFFFSLAQLWSLSLFSLRGCEQKAIKPLQSLVRHCYRNERWRDTENAWAATHFMLKWGNEWLSEGRKERWARRGFSCERETKVYMIYAMRRKSVKRVNVNCRGMLEDYRMQWWEMRIDCPPTERPFSG